MDPNQRLQLQNMIRTNNTEDQTETIRSLKHSQLIRSDVANLMLLKSKYKDDDAKIYEESLNECNFIFTYYYDIYNKLRKDELDIKILNQFLDVLKQIEDGLLDQHEGSYKVGMLLKDLYINSALKKAEKLDSLNEEVKNEPKKPNINISWKQFKLGGKIN